MFFFGNSYGLVREVFDLIRIWVNNLVFCGFLCENFNLLMQSECSFLVLEFQGVFFLVFLCFVGAFFMVYKDKVLIFFLISVMKVACFQGRGC